MKRKRSRTKTKQAGAGNENRQGQDTAQDGIVQGRMAYWLRGGKGCQAGIRTGVSVMEGPG